MTGQVIKTTKFNAAAGDQYIISLDGFLPGMYIFTIRDATGKPVQAEKIQVMR